MKSQILPGDICFNIATAPKVNFVFSLKNGKDAILFFKKNTQIPAVAHQAGLASEILKWVIDLRPIPRLGQNNILHWLKYNVEKYQNYFGWSFTTLLNHKVASDMMRLFQTVCTNVYQHVGWWCQTEKTSSYR